MNIVKEGDVMPAYYGAVNTSCALDRCLKKSPRDDRLGQQVPCARPWQWQGGAPWYGHGHAGSGISGMDVGSATLKVNDDGFYSLIIGAADMGTGCDTTLLRSPPRCWTVTWTISPSLARIPTPRPMTPAPTLPLPPMSPARQWKSAPPAARPDLQAGRGAAPDDRRCRGF
mgnify:CR=1 FL=1